MIKALINTLMIIGLLFGLNLAFAQTPALSQHTHDINPATKNKTNTRVIGPWTLHCEKKSYPNKAQARRYTNGKQVKLTICSAKQTITQYADNKLITASYEITPFSVFFATRNIHAKQTNAQIITGTKRTFGLYTDCQNIHNETCVYMLRQTKYHHLLKDAMKNSFHLILTLKESNTTTPINLVFSLEYINDILYEMQNEEQTINNSFKQAFNDQEYWRHYAMMETDKHETDCSLTNSCSINNFIAEP